MEKNLTESQLRNIVYNTIKESLNEMYYIEDEGDGAIYANVSDKDEAIADAQDMAANGGHFLVKDENDEVIFDTGGPSYKFESIKMNESQLREHVFNSIKNGLQNFADKAYYGFARKDIANPALKDVIEQNGWTIKKSKPSQDGGTLYQISQITGAFANTDASLDLDELVEDINVFLKGEHCFIKSRKNQFSGYSDAEDAIIFVK